MLGSGGKRDEQGQIKEGSADHNKSHCAVLGSGKPEEDSEQRRDMTTSISSNDCSDCY